MPSRQLGLGVVSAFLFLMLNFQAIAQPGQCLPGGCNAGIAYGANQSTASGTFVNSVAVTYAGEFNRYNVVAGNQYEWSLCAADGAVNPTPDMVLTLADDLSNTILCFSDNVCGLQPKILWTANLTGVVRVYLHSVGCGMNTNSHTVRWRCVGCAAPPPPVVASDCSNAVNICTNSTFQIDPNGAGNIVEFGVGTVSNPSVNPSSTNAGCLLEGELNSTWMIVNIASTGTLEFSFGIPGGFGCLDWIMWPYAGATTCDQILNNQLAPIRCNWNANCQNFTGMATPLPAGGLPGDF